MRPIKDLFHKPSAYSALVSYFSSLTMGHKSRSRRTRPLGSLWVEQNCIIKGSFDSSCRGPAWMDPRASFALLHLEDENKNGCVKKTTFNTVSHFHWVKLFNQHQSWSSLLNNGLSWCQAFRFQFIYIDLFIVIQISTQTWLFSVYHILLCIIWSMSKISNNTHLGAISFCVQ